MCVVLSATPISKDFQVKLTIMSYMLQNHGQAYSLNVPACILEPIVTFVVP